VVTFPNGTSRTVTWDSKLNWQATATPRLGWVWNGLLLYGKGGLAAGGANVSVFRHFDGEALSATQQRVGWTAGAGLEYALSPNWVFGIEYDFVNLGTENYAGWDPAAVRFFSEDVKLKYSEVLGRLSYKFDGMR
jgi:outer membrane immunogenic protein